MKCDLDAIEKAMILYTSKNNKVAVLSNNYRMKKVSKDTLKQSVIEALNSIGDDCSEIYELDKEELKSYIDSTKYNLNTYYYSLKSNTAINIEGKEDSKRNIHHILNK